MIKIARTELFAGQIGGEGGGLLRISSDRDNQRILAGGFEIFDFGIFCGRKILASMFFLFKQGFFWVFQN